MSASNELFFILPVVVATLLVGIGADPPFTYKEGVWGQGDAVFINCTVNIKGTFNAFIELTTPFKTKTKGAFITYIRVDNLKPFGEKASIKKTGGGINSPFVTFYLKSLVNHGFLFQFYIYGRTPLGTFENPLTGDCGFT